MKGHFQNEQCPCRDRQDYSWQMQSKASQTKHVLMKGLRLGCGLEKHRINYLNVGDCIGDVEGSPIL